VPTRINTIDTAHLLFRLVAVLSLVFFGLGVAGAGDPKFIAGSSYFNSSTMGQPIKWSLGQVNYYTDQGDLSPILPNSAANAFVANAFSQWTSVSTAAVAATSAGQLAEDVNGSNIAVDSSGTVTAPADITPAATQDPVGIVYDYDGSVTDALLGTGAGDPSQCFSNAVFGGLDNFGAGANFLHALVVVNGQCALQSSQLTDVEYRLVRVLGSVLGLDWSQLNLNVITGNPTPTPDDFAGFPVMHYMDLSSCVPITVCYPNPYQLSSDDVAALSRLYPASTSGNARIHGSVYFVDHLGGLGQPMQGVNVFARWIDPSTGLPSHKYAASSVSGFLFTGNAGNPITGLDDPLGNAYSEFGSSDQPLEGFFDLGGLPIPNGAGTAQYQLAVEALDPLWSAGVGPYDPSQVAPSGTMEPIVVTVSAGGDFEQDIVMSGSAQAVPSWAATETWNAPAPIPSPGDWIGSLSGYGDVGYFVITAQANRTLSIAVTALDETGVPSESKAAPVVGIWTVGDPQGTPPPSLTTAPFNSETFGMSLLSAQILGSSSFIIGISDLRGDGRPDYQYHAHVLYADSATPPRISVNGGAISLQGTGFVPGLTVSVGSVTVPLLATNASQMLANVPAQSDGVQSVSVNDPVSGASSIMTNALTVGAGPTDEFYKSQFLQGGSNPQTPVGIQAVNPVIALIVASDGVTPVGGATVGWTTTNGAKLSTCGGASSCSAISDESGIASTWVTPGDPGNATITAMLAPAVYNPPQSISTTLTATSTSSDIGVTNPNLWIAQGASLSVPLTTRVVSQGIPQNGVTVNFFLGSASSPFASAVTDGNGYATVTLALTNFTTGITVSACVGQANSPCQNINVFAVSQAQLNLQPVAGAGQIVTGAAFQPLTVRVTDSSTPPNPVLAASVLFQSTVLRPVGNDPIPQPSNSSGTQTAMPIILGSTQVIVESNADGLASFVPTAGSFTGTLEIEIMVSVGTAASLEGLMESFPQP
jgi:IPT/TIG domain-containing protein